MNTRKKVIIAILLVSFFIVYGICVYNTNQKYKPPQQKYYGLNDTVECAGMSYTLISMDSYLIDELAEKYDFVPEDLNITNDYVRRYYIACVEITKLTEDAKLTEIGKYNKYSSSNSFEIFVEDFINDGLIYNSQLEIGETVRYYFVKSLIDYAFSEDTWNNLDESDLWLRLYDEENGYEYFLGTDL